jgi:hypothetical protein
VVNARNVTKPEHEQVECKECRERNVHVHGVFTRFKPLTIEQHLCKVAGSEDAKELGIVQRANAIPAFGLPGLHHVQTFRQPFVSMFGLCPVPVHVATSTLFLGMPNVAAGAVHAPIGVVQIATFPVRLVCNQ